MPKSSTLTQRRAVGAARDEQVRRLEVAVDDAGGVRLGERLARLEDVARTASSTGSAPSRAMSCAEVAPLEVLHDDVRHAVVSSVPDVDDARDVLALHLRGDARLAEEALDGLRAAHRLAAAGT